MTILSFIIALAAFTVVGPFVGGLIDGIDRKISARLQGRVGPPILQPFYDVKKLLAKDSRGAHAYQGFYVFMSLVFTILSGVFFFAGGNFLLVAFILVFATMFFVVAAYCTRSPYAEIGAQREIIQIMSYEPLVILLAVSLFMATQSLSGSGSFNVAALITLDKPLILVVPLVFLALVYVLTIKLRKSPFDLSHSHHAHQELVKGISTEMSGKTLAMVDIIHWYETVLFMGWIALFFIWGSWIAALVIAGVIIVVYFLEILIDNNFARVKWKVMLASSWIVTFVCVAANMVLLQTVFI